MPVKPWPVLVGGLVGRAAARGCAASGSSSVERLRSSIVCRNWRSGLPSRGAFDRQLAQLARSPRVDSADAPRGRPRPRRPGRRSSRATRARTARRRAGSGQLRRRAAQLAQRRDLASAVRSSWAIVGSSSAQEARAGGSSSGPAPRCARPGSPAVSAASSRPARHVLLDRARPRCDTRVGVADEVADDPCSGGAGSRASRWSRAAPGGRGG